MEFQKRGLPHCHILLTLAAEDKPRNATEVDAVVQAVIPDPSGQGGEALRRAAERDTMLTAYFKLNAEHEAAFGAGNAPRGLFCYYNRVRHSYNDHTNPLRSSLSLSSPSPKLHASEAIGGERLKHWVPFIALTVSSTKTLKKNTSLATSQEQRYLSA
ncbi:unnamed protein product [Haemonchus placei]|uniref:Helitron_like_N domain-containing protein n=1 Tax=Haemonchus placei TaxID=6290 RepID=A0A0N4WMR1_HAEPC|nr:unnamed protein product [Haemonchus placei]